MSNSVKAVATTTHPLPLSSTLHDLALLRASDLDFASLLPAAPEKAGEISSDDNVTAVEDSVQRSIQFSREARAALKLLHSDAVEREGARVDQMRQKLEDAVKGLDGTDE
uniref:Extracellular lipase (EC) n=1 Tax=Ganoderma boninense TaxID=34458 RepID=A0A5K1K5P9_9APHY|nr:Extracellular lipase (EC [Ganoderma boninense]